MKIWVIALCMAMPAFGAVAAHGQSMNCNGAPPTEHVFDRQPQDVVEPHHVELVRLFDSSGKLTIHVCEAEMKVRARPGGHELRLVVDLGPSAGGRAVTDFLQRVQVASDKGVVFLKLPKAAHASVLLEVPMGTGSATEMNLGRGSFDFAGKDAAGTREINVGLGDVRLAIGDNANYATLEVNVGMGSFHDRRPGGTSGHMAIARDFAGTGKGSVEVDIGMGKVEIVE